MRSGPKILKHVARAGLQPGLRSHGQVVTDGLYGSFLGGSPRKSLRYVAKARTWQDGRHGTDEATTDRWSADSEGSRLLCWGAEELMSTLKALERAYSRPEVKISSRGGMNTAPKATLSGTVSGLLVRYCRAKRRARRR